MTATHTIELETPVAITPLTRETLRRLASIRADHPVVVTAYIRLGVEDRIRNRYRIAVRDAIRQATMAFEQPGIPHDVREMLSRDLDRLQGWVEHPDALPHSAGVVVFACESLGLLEAVPLPKVLQTRVLLDQRPRLAETVAAAERMGRILVALLDRAHARFFEVTASGAEELPGLALPATRGGKFHSDRGDAPGWGEREFHNRIREERHRHAAEVGECLARLLAGGPCDGIVLAGPVRMTADQLRFLPTALADKVLGTSRLNPTSATVAEVRAAALEARERWERTYEHRITGELQKALGAGWAVNGARATLRALGMGKVRFLLVPEGEKGFGYRCGDTGRLVLSPTDCRGEGEPVPVADLVNGVIEEALRQRIEIEIVEDPAAKKTIDGLAGFLRFR